jgi:hypothetical protein
MQISLKLRKIAIFFVLLSCSMALMNCSKKNDDSPDAQIVGNWKMTKYLQKEGTAAEENLFPELVLEVPCVKDVVFTFKSNGELTSVASATCKEELKGFPGIDGVSKYEVKDGKLITTNPDNDVLTQDVSFSGSEMTWASSYTNAGVVTTLKFVFTKQ